MSAPIRPQRVNHFNAVVADFDASVAHLRDLYGAEFIVDMPQREWHACLVGIGRVIIELFVPHDFLLNSRHGAHFVGIEYQADIEAVRTAIAARGIRTVRDIGLALHTHPADCFGTAFEFYAGSFHDREWPALGGHMKPAEYWRDEHPLGLTGLVSHTVAVNDLDAASVFYRHFLDARIVYDEARHAVGARAIGLQVADAIVEILTPTSDGALRHYLHRHGEGIRSIVFGTRDLNQAKRYFSRRNVPMIAGTASNSFAIPPAANLGLLFEFIEATP